MTNYWRTSIKIISINFIARNKDVKAPSSEPRHHPGWAGTGMTHQECTALASLAQDWDVSHPLAQYLLGMDQENLPPTTPPPPSYRYRDAGVIQPPKYMYRVSHITSVLGSLYSITQYTINVCLISCPHTIGPTWQVRNINGSTALTHIILVRATAPFQCQNCWRYFLFVIFLLANFNIIRCNHKTVK